MGSIPVFIVFMAMKKSKKHQKKVISRLAAANGFRITIDLDYLTIPAAIKQLEKLAKEHKDKKNLKISLEEKPWDEGSELCLRYDDLETDVEFEKRLAQEKQSEEWQKQQYEQLRKKFEKK